MDYFNLSLANEYIGDITIPTQVIKYNQFFLQADQPIRLQYSHQITLFIVKSKLIFFQRDPKFLNELLNLCSRMFQI